MEVLIFALEAEGDQVASHEVTQIYQNMGTPTKIAKYYLLAIDVSLYRTCVLNCQIVGPIYIRWHD